MRIFYYTFKIIFRNFYASVITAPLSAAYAVLNFREENTHYIILSDHIGDSLLALGYLRAYRRKYRAEKIVVVCRQGWEKVLCFYPREYDTVLILPAGRLHQVMTLGSTNFGQHVLGKLPHVRVINPANDFTGDYFYYISRFPHVTLKDCIKYGILNLDRKAEFVPPCAAQSSRRKPEEPGRRVIVSPYAAVTRADIRFFEQLAEALLRDGYDVYTNTARGEEPLPGTKRLDSSLPQLMIRAQNCCAVIGLRSGLLDLLMYSKCRLIALYPRGDVFQRFFSLGMLEHTAAEYEELELSGSGNAERDITRIKEWMKKERKTL